MTRRAFADGLARFDGLLRESAGAPDRPVRVVVVRRPIGVGGWLRHLARRLDRQSRHRPPRVH